MASEGIDVRSVGNTLILNETALIEALNLKFAIEYRAGNMKKAAVCLSDMPPRSEEELDPVTLHNQALMNVDANLADSFAKLQYLLTQLVFIIWGYRSAVPRHIHIPSIYCRFN